MVVIFPSHDLRGFVDALVAHVVVAGEAVEPEMTCATLVVTFEPSFASYSDLLSKQSVIHSISMSWRHAHFL